MNTINRVALTISAGTAPSPFSNRYLATTEGLHHRALLIGRHLGFFGPIVNGLVTDAISVGFEDRPSIRRSPIGHGWESVVFASNGMNNPGESVFKVNYPRLTVSAEDITRQSLDHWKLYREYLGNCVVESEFVVVPSPFSSHNLAVTRQPLVRRSTSDATPSAEGLARFVKGVQEMVDNTGCMPDICGKDNIRVKEDGEIVLTDVGSPVHPNRWDYHRNMKQLDALCDLGK